VGQARAYLVFLAALLQFVNLVLALRYVIAVLGHARLDRARLCFAGIPLGALLLRNGHGCVAWLLPAPSCCTAKALLGVESLAQSCHSVTHNGLLAPTPAAGTNGHRSRVRAAAPHWQCHGLWFKLLSYSFKMTRQTQ